MTALPPLDGRRTVIEASAGTGKTHTVAASVARLVASEGVPIDSILVVTFTRAATAELRSRIRRRLVTLQWAADGRPGDIDDVTSAILDGGDHGEIRRRVAKALSDFDRAPISTIDAFAQRVLTELGFGSRLAVDVEPTAVDRRHVTEAAIDLVVARYATNGGDPLDTREVVEIGARMAGVPDAGIVPDVATVEGRNRERVEMAHRLRAEVERRIRNASLVTFDDALEEVASALEDPAVGAAARALVARRFRIGLVDEAQDTNPRQWDVVQTVFADARLVLIGDPKQSIYAFRGADVASYLAAAEGTEPVPLTVNWRSDGPLLAALDIFFHDATFGDHRIGYRRVEPAPEHRNSQIEGVEAALSIRWLASDLDLPRRQNDKYKVDGARRAVAGDVGAHIVELLHGGVTITGDGGREPLRPSDIAVLCRTSRQVDLVREALDRRDVPSVAGRSGAVFASDAAEAWRRFLTGVETPDRSGPIRLAATSALVGMSLRDVAALDDEAELDLQTTMRELGGLLRTDGVPAVVAQVERTWNLTARILSQSDGERFLTDLTHIAEELHAAWRPGRIGSLLDWLDTAVAESKERAEHGADEPESRQRRLETDAEAVQVLTIHASKGLEFPVVMVPFAWDPALFRPDVPIFHHPTHATRRLIDVAGPRPKGSSPRGSGGSGAEGDEGGADTTALEPVALSQADPTELDDAFLDFAANQRRAMEEDAAEESRLLYVALTRARHHLVVWWVKNHENAKDSMLGQLLARDGFKGDARSAPPGVITRHGIHALAPEIPYRPQTSVPEALDVATFDRPLDHLWRRASFTSLATEHPLSVDTAPEAETIDEVIPEDEPPVEPLEPAADPSVTPMADLPRGARFGTLVHDIFEQVDFAAPDLDGAIRTAVHDALVGTDWDFEPDTLVSALLAAAATPLGPDSGAPTLSGTDRVLKEMVFELPVRTATDAVTLIDVASVMADHLDPSDPFRRYLRHLEAMEEQPFRGFLTGAIDLTLILPDDRWVVMDYKTNALTDYGRDGLEAAMIDGNYVLQATLYQVALHRYLRWRLPGYEPDRHLGGSIYLFLRGVSGPDTPVFDGVRAGVHRWTPPPAMIVALSDLFERRP